MKKLLQIAAGLVLVAQFASAEESRPANDSGASSHDISGTLSGARNLRVTVEAGAVRIEGTDQSDIKYALRNRGSEDRAKRNSENYRVTGNVRGDTAYIVAEFEGGRSHHFSGDFDITVPRGIESVSVETQGGGVTALHLGGKLDIQSGGGQLRVEDVKGAVHAETGGDNVEIASVGGDLNLQTGGGRITLRDVKGSLNASTGGGDVMLVSSQSGAVLETGGGNIQVEQCGGKLRASTGGGNIDIGDAAGPVEIETGGGSIRVGSAKGFVRAETGAGRIELNGVPAAKAETGSGSIVVRLVNQGSNESSVLETGSGDIAVYLDPALHINVRAAIDMANGHTISSDFSEIKVVTEGGEWGPKEVSAQGGLNGGGAVVKLTTASGNIQIKRGH
ncbi:MAG TPA: DUF4097 family beta strand repeat-containing protein [Terriglobales bacterium]|nr:DUF4097 family beta strand repeat-containing protein [Terriglobales bacterium]